MTDGYRLVRYVTRMGAGVAVGALTLLLPVGAFAQAAAAAPPPPTLNGGDTAWMLIATALVLLMTPALAFFYGGLVRSKNALNTMMMSFISLGFVALAWAFVGYSLAFTAGGNYLGDLSRLFLRGVALEPAPRSTNIPHVLYMA